MNYVILHPRELELVRDAIIRARRDRDAEMLAFWRRVEDRLIKGDLEISEADVAFVHQHRGAWWHGYQNAMKAIASAVDRHS